jgi:hypothetical protein
MAGEEWDVMRELDIRSRESVTLPADQVGEPCAMCGLPVSKKEPELYICSKHSNRGWCFTQAELDEHVARTGESKCKRCHGRGEVAKMPEFGIFVGDSAEALHTEPCKECRGTGRDGYAVKRLHAKSMLVVAIASYKEWQNDGDVETFLDWVQDECKDWGRL